MRNNFRFKQFEIEQLDAPMPVTTDACILGAIAKFDTCADVLDIGCGTGLLGLMVAQNHAKVQITGVDIQPQSVKTAIYNAQKSPWKDRISIKEMDVLSERFLSQFDGIICNPPFFENQLASAMEGKRLARHTGNLNYGNLIKKISELLLPHGIVWLLVPNLHVEIVFGEMKKANLYVTENWHIKSMANKAPHVHVLKLEKLERAVSTFEFITYSHVGVRSEQLNHLMQEFYL